MKFEHLIEYISVKIFVFFILNLPLKLTYFFSEILSDIVFFIFRIRRKTVLENLKIAFGKEKSYTEILKIARNTYSNILKTFIETLYYDIKYKPEQLKDKFFLYYGKEYLEKSYKQNKGTIIVSGHFGNWELLGTSIIALGYPTTFIVAEFKNKLVNKVINNYRKQKGVKIIYRETTPLKNIIKMLKNNEFVCFASDQDAGSGGIFVDFFGRLSSTPQGAAAFCLKTGANIIVAMGIPSEDRKFLKAVFIPVEIQKTSNKEKDIYLYTQKFTKIIEEYIRKYPQHYFWLHKRWKTVF